MLGGRIIWSRTANCSLSEVELCRRIWAALERKLPKLQAHSVACDAIRILVIQNDEICRGFKTDYARFVRGYLHRNRKRACDEIWAMELFGSDLECVLLWSKVLDVTTGKNPFRDDALSLNQLVELRLLAWIASRTPEVRLG